MSPQQERFILFLLAVVNFTHIIDGMLMMPLGDIFMKLFDINASQLSFLIASYAIFAGVAAIGGIFFLDKFDRKKGLLICYTGFAVGTLSCAFMNTYMSLLIARALTGLFGGLINALLLSIVSDIFQFERRGKAMSIIMSAFAVAAAVGMPFALYSAELYNWQMPFLILGIVGVGVSIVIYMMFPSMTGHLKDIDQNKTPLLTILKDRNQIDALLLAFVLFFGHMMIIPFITPFLINNVGLIQSDITLLYLVGGIATVFASIYFGIMTDKVGAFKLYVILLFISFIPLVILVNLGTTPLWQALVLSTLVFVFLSGRMIPSQTMMTAAASVENRGSYMSAKAAVQQLGVGFAVIVGGMIVAGEKGEPILYYDIAGYVSILIILLSIPLARRLKVAKGN